MTVYRAGREARNLSSCFLFPLNDSFPLCKDVLSYIFQVQCGARFFRRAAFDAEIVRKEVTGRVGSKLPVRGLTDRKRMDILYIVIPAYNEEANIGDVIESWYPIIEKHNGGGQSRLVIIDDGSRDRTLEIMQEAAKTRPLLVPLTKENKGHGATVLYGYKYALREGADFIFQTDSDGQTLPEEFEPFWERRNEYDLIAGWRRGRQDGFSRKVITSVLRGTVKFTFGLDLRDVNVPYRLMKAETLRKWIGLVPPDFNLTNIAVMAIFGKVGARILSIPVTFRPRQGGKSTVNVRKIGGIGIQALRDFRKLNRAIDRAIEYRDIE